MATKTSSKPTKEPPSSTPPSRSSSSSLSSHFAMIELKQRILTTLSKLSDRDTHQIAVDDLQNIIQTISPDGVSMLLNCLYDSTNDPKSAVKKESIRLLSFLCATHPDSTATHLPKIIVHIVKRLKDSDSGVKDACRDAIGQLSSQYFKGGDSGSVVSLFVKPLFEAMNEQNKGVQAGSSMCMAKMVDLATDPPVAAFQKLCPRICKNLNNPNFLAKAALLPVIASLSQACLTVPSIDLMNELEQVGAIAPQGLETLLQSIHESLNSTDWATRKAAAETLSALAIHSSNLITEGTAASTLTALEVCRFDKIKPVRDCIIEALQIWKNKAGIGAGGVSDGQKTSSRDGENSEPVHVSENSLPNSAERRIETSSKDLSTKVSNISNKAVGILKKKAPALTDKDLNPEFFQRLQTRGSGDLPVEVVVPRRSLKSSDPHNGEDNAELNDVDGRVKLRDNKQSEEGFISGRYRIQEQGNGSASSRQRDFDDKNDQSQRDSSAIHVGQSEGFMSNKGNWLAIQRQLLQLERQQTHLMNMLQDFMGGSHDGMVTLENRVRGLERIVEDMARDLSLSSGRRGSNYMMGFEESSSRSSNKYKGFSEYPNSFTASGMRGRGPWRSDMPESWDYHNYGRSPKSEREGDSRRAWGDKGVGPVRFGEGPSARSVWQASKDEATLQAIRVAGEDNGPTRTTRVAIPEMTAEALGDDNSAQERDPVWTAWNNAMDALHVGDMDSAYAEVVSTGDELLLVKLMDRSGPVIDQLSGEVASEVLHSVAQFLVEQNLYDICLSWIQQLVDYTSENGNEVLDIPMEVQRELLLNLHNTSSACELPEDWEGMAPDQLLLQLASAWDFDLQQLDM